MRAVVQRVSRASVSVDGEAIGEIEAGLVVLLAVEEGDGEKDLAFVSRKIVGLRVFDDPDGRMDLSVRDIGGAILLISQFTLLGDCRKGNRPSYSRAAPPETARQLYEEFGRRLEGEGLAVARGRFQARMRISLVNEGPVTLVLDSRW